MPLAREKIKVVVTSILPTVNGAYKKEGQTHNVPYATWLECAPPQPFKSRPLHEPWGAAYSTRPHVE